MPLKGVIYDLDGTLVDSRDDLADSVNAMLARLSLPEREPQVIHGFIGEGAERLIRRSLGPRHEARYAEAAPIWRLGERAALASADYLCDTPMEVGELLARLRS